MLSLQTLDYAKKESWVKERPQPSAELPRLVRMQGDNGRRRAYSSSKNKKTDGGYIQEENENSSVNLWRNTIKTNTKKGWIYK